MLPTDFGHCPICQKKLRLDGDFLECPDGHWRAIKVRVDQAWQDYNEASARVANSLLQSLLDLNLK